MITIQLDAVNVEMHEAQSPAGLVRLMICTDPQSGLRVIIPFDERSAYTTGNGLLGKKAVEIAGANGMPKGGLQQ